MMDLEERPEQDASETLSSSEPHGHGDSESSVTDTELMASTEDDDEEISDEEWYAADEIEGVR